MDTLNELVANMPTHWAVEGQIEEGIDSQQKRHAQLFLRTEQTRGTKVAKFFPHSHIEVAKNKFALQNYVHKEDTRVAEFKTIENRSPQWSVVVDKFFDYMVANHPTAMEEQYEHIKLEHWDEFIRLSIREGMRIDVIGVNPQYRSCIIRYWTAYWHCADQRTIDNPSIDKKTDKTKDKMEEVAEGGVSVEQGGGIPAVKIRKTVRARV